MLWGFVWLLDKNIESITLGHGRSQMIYTIKKRLTCSRSSATEGAPLTHFSFTEVKILEKYLRQDKVITF